MRNRLPAVLCAFFNQYLKVERGLSPNTVLAYRDTIKLLLRYVAKQLGKSEDDLRIEEIEQKRVLDFLEHGEKERGWKPSTRNQRLAATKTFFRFIAREHPDLMLHADTIRSIANKNAEAKPPEHLEEDEMNAFLDSIDGSTPLGVRDEALLQTFYSTGARVSEIAGVEIEDLRLDDSGEVRLHGKGQKLRCTPLLPEAVKAIRNYLDIRQPKDPDERRLFLNARGEPITRFGIRHLLKKHGAKAAENCPSIRTKTITPHLMRHTAAMHLLRAGVDLFSVSQRLGHANPNTTNLYIESDMEMKRQIIEKLNPPKTQTKKPWRNPKILDFLDNLAARPPALCEVRT